MKISTKLIQSYLDFELPPIDELVRRIGSQLGEVEEVTSLAEKYAHIPVVSVVSCQKVEDSDHLQRCLIDDGQFITNCERNKDGLVQVVTGAPNA